MNDDGRDEAPNRLRVAHRFGGGGYESQDDWCAPPLKRRGTQLAGTELTDRERL